MFTPGKWVRAQVKALLTSHLMAWMSILQLVGARAVSHPPCPPNGQMTKICHKAEQTKQLIAWML